MEIIKIQESGNNNILKWAIKSKANIYDDISLQNIIANDLEYLVTIQDVNFFELFQFSRTYRDTMRVIEEEIADMPLRKDIIKFFPGEYTDQSTSKTTPLYELAEDSIQKFINLALQMKTDSDIIKLDTVRMFFPMITRKFTIIISVSFQGLVKTLQNSDNAKKLFNENYPESIYNFFFSDDKMNANLLLMNIENLTEAIQYNDHYEKLLNITKYAPLRKVSDNDLFKFRLSGFYKDSVISKSRTSCTMFNADKTELQNNIEKIKQIKGDLCVSFIIQIPIQYMFILYNSFSAEELQFTFESSIANIISNSITFNDFITYSGNEEDIEKYNNSIESYRFRIGEANNQLLSLLPILLSNEKCDATQSFSILPSIYTTKCILTLNMKYANKYINHFDANISTMFEKMIDIAKSL